MTENTRIPLRELQQLDEDIQAVKEDLEVFDRVFTEVYRGTSA